MTLQTALIAVSAVVLLSAPASAKTGSTYYPPDIVVNARRNIERYDWAKETRDYTLRGADVYAKQTDDFLWDLITPQDIPRGTQVNVKRGCPKCGKAIEKFGSSPWKCSVINRPWKIECPSCREVFPKNDFAKYYESGKDEHRVFHPNRADRSLLFNTDHPDPEDPLHTYGVDDGLGWKDDKGDVFRFVGYYDHYGVWSAVSSALHRFRDAYLYTGDPFYARKAGILLYRIAEFYPDMDWSKWNKLGFNNSDGGTGLGKIYGCIWENGLATQFMTAYDAVYPALDAPQLLDYLSKKTGKKVTAVDLRGLIEKNIVREAHDSILRRRIVGNEGMYQNTMATAAVVLDEPGTSDKWLEWIFADGNVRRGDPKGGNLKRLFETRVDDDGMGDEASPSYNSIWRNTFHTISDVLERYPRYKGTRLTDFPKYKRMFEAPVRLICLEKYIPSIGDCGKTGVPGTGSISTDDLVYAYRTFKNPRFAQMAAFVSRVKGEQIRGGIFDAEPEAIKPDIDAIVKERGEYVPATENMPAYGLAVLRSGKGADSRALTLYYGRNLGHGHKDTLNIELFGLGLNLMPDMGYPEHATVWPARYEWTSNTTSHNTVLVDRMKQRENIRGKARFMAQSNGAAAAEVYADSPYPKTSLYQRTAAMVDVSDKEFYVVDIFRVRGGNEQHYSLHGPEGEVETEGLKMAAQAKGTLAGEDIPLAADLGSGKDYWANASGFQYLYDVRRDANPPKQAAVTWKVKDTWNALEEPKDVRLRMNLLSAPGEVILAHGDPPQNKPGNPRRLTYLLAANKSNAATFVSVIEPYTGARFIKSIERTDEGDTMVIKVTLASGRVDYIVSGTQSGAHNVGGASFTGRFGVVSTESGKAQVRLVIPFPQHL